jgi:Tfp pilus assembly protein PilF
LNPINVLAHHNRGVALDGLELFDQAVGAYDAAIALVPNLADAWNNRGVALANLQRFSESLESYDKALSINPGRADIHVNRGCALGELKRFAQAMASHDKALSLNPKSADAWYNRGVALTELKRIEDAVLSYRQCLALEPDYLKAAYNMGLCLLQLGRFEEGMRLYEKRPPTWLHHYPQRHWSGGEDISGKTLLVRAEQGLGDIIQFSRYLALLQDKGAEIILAVPDKLVRLLKSLPWAVKIVSENEAISDFDYQVSEMSLPFVFRTVLENIPADIPYLAAEPELAGKWKDRIGGGGFKIGIGWQTSATGARIGKSFPLRQYAGLSNIPGVRLISLQRHDEAAPVNDLPDGMVVEQLGAEFDGGADAFIDSAALMQSLDLVITPDTAIAHLAGALGRPVWLALKYVPEWRWLLDRADSPWYPTMRLFRQPESGDWDGLFAQMQAELAALVAGRAR